MPKPEVFGQSRSLVEAVAKRVAPAYMALAFLYIGNAAEAGPYGGRRQTSRA